MKFSHFRYRFRKLTTTHKKGKLTSIGTIYARRIPVQTVKRLVVTLVFTAFAGIGLLIVYSLCDTDIQSYFPAFFKPISPPRSFIVEKSKRHFLKDGKHFRYVAGSFHYSRTLPAGWHDRLLKMKAAGLNAVQTYVFWNFHSTEEGHYDFTGAKNIEKFLKLANDTGLLVILRAGPYVCSEWEFGGLPWYLLRNGSITLRSSDEKFLFHVDKWFDVFLPKMKPLLYENGGPIIMVQFENEYGSLGLCDKDYLQHLVDKFRQHLGYDVVLFTTDIPSQSHLTCGSLETELATIAFGATTFVTSKFEILRDFQPRAPLVNSQLNTGWLNLWGRNFYIESTKHITESLESILEMGVSVSLYMFVGGTNFGYTSGSLIHRDGQNSFHITSYDYDAPITESGDLTAKYFAIKDVLSRFFGNKKIQLPSNSTKASLMGVKIEPKGCLMNFFDLLTNKTEYKSSKFPQTMENLGFGYGFVVYRTQLLESSEEMSTLVFQIDGIGDRTTILASNEDYSMSIYLGSVDNDIRFAPQLKLRHIPAGFYLVLLIENRGRPFTGMSSDVHGFKGLKCNVTLNKKLLINWEMTRLTLENLGRLELLNSIPLEHSASLPLVYQAKVSMDLKDSFLNLKKFQRGFAFVDDFSLGRYWTTVGPQNTLYVPASARTSRTFLLTLVEFEPVEDNDLLVDFQDYPILDGDVRPSIT